jgi:zinc/manganese transport system permease protein
LIQDLLLAPFEPGFMRRALAGCVALSLAAPPLGVLLVLRRMSLTSDGLQHGILPGIALGAALGGAAAGGPLLPVPLLPVLVPPVLVPPVWPMALGGFVAGLAVVLLAGWLARATGGREDSQLAALYLLALAVGVAVISTTRGIDLTHVLFGNVLAVDRAGLLLMAGAATLALAGLAVLWRPLVVESFDPDFLAAMGGRGGAWHLGFMALVVLCVVAGFAALGTLMSVGLMMVPAVAARHFSARLSGQVRAAVAVALLASLGGLLLSYHADLPAGPAIVLAAGGQWLAGMVLGPQASLRARLAASRAA